MSNAKNSVLTLLLPCFKVGLEVKGLVKVTGQGHGSRSNLWPLSVHAVCLCVE